MNTEFALDASGDLAVPVTILTGAPAVAQRVKIRLRWFFGEWFLDQRQGIPYYEKILIKNPDLVLVNAILTKVLVSTPGIKHVSSLNASWDKITRKLTVDYQATVSDGTILTVSEPFIISEV